MEIQILNWLQSLHTPILDKINAVNHTFGRRGNYMDNSYDSYAPDSKTRKGGVIMASALIVDVILCNVILKI